MEKQRGTGGVGLKILDGRHSSRRLAGSGETTHIQRLPPSISKHAGANKLLNGLAFGLPKPEMSKREGQVRSSDCPREDTIRRSVAAGESISLDQVFMLYISHNGYNPMRDERPQTP